MSLQRGMYQQECDSDGASRMGDRSTKSSDCRQIELRLSAFMVQKNMTPGTVKVESQIR